MHSIFGCPRCLDPQQPDCPEEVLAQMIRSEFNLEPDPPPPILCTDCAPSFNVSSTLGAGEPCDFCAERGVSDEV